MDLLPFESDDDPMYNNSAFYSLGELTGTSIRTSLVSIKPGLEIWTNMDSN